MSAVGGGPMHVLLVGDGQLGTALRKRLATTGSIK
jgi:predicted dinucleotide-binding enzyme